METLPSNDGVKLCINCHYIATNGSHSWEAYQCMSPKNPSRINPVTGAPMYLVKLCVSVRESPNHCTINGYWYTEKDVTQVPRFDPSSALISGLPSRKPKSADTISLDDIG